MAESDSEEYHSAEEDIAKDKDTICTNGSKNKEHMAETTSPVTEAQSLHGVADSLRETHLAESCRERTNVPTSETLVESDNRGAEAASGGEFVSNLDNRYISEAVDVKDEKIELTEEQIKVHQSVVHILYIYIYIYIYGKL